MLKSLEMVDKKLDTINELANHNKENPKQFMNLLKYEELQQIKQDLKILEIIINDILMVAVGNNKIKYIDLKSIIDTKKMFKLIQYMESNKVGDSND